MQDETKKIIIVSDGTGRTAKRLMDAILVQYYQKDLVFSLESTHMDVRTREDLDRILSSITNDCLVLYSIITRKLAEYFHEQLTEREIFNLDVLKPMLNTMSKFLGVHPGYKPGILHVVDNRYYKKIDAIGYAVEHDDGRGQLINDADLVLLGLSRSCKTPISMYLACNYGLKVANIPIVNDNTMTKNMLRRLKPVKQDKIIGLLMQPETMAHVREERANTLATGPRGKIGIEAYFDIREVAREFRYCRDIYQRCNWKTIDVTRRAIEEVSLEILKELGYSDSE